MVFNRLGQRRLYCPACRCRLSPEARRAGACQACGEVFDPKQVPRSERMLGRKEAVEGWVRVMEWGALGLGAAMIVLGVALCYSARDGGGMPAMKVQAVGAIGLGIHLVRRHENDQTWYPVLLIFGCCWVTLGLVLALGWL